MRIQKPELLHKSFYNLKENWNYFKYTIIDVNEFYPKILNRGGITVELPHYFEDGVFFSTYHCRVEGLIPNMEYGMSLYGAVNTTCRIWCNGRLVGTGGFFSRSRYFARAGQVSGIVEFQADDAGVADLVFHVADFETKSGGVVNTVQFAEKEYCTSIFYRNYFFNKFLTAFLLSLLFYNLILIFMNLRQKNYGFQAALILCYVLSISVMGGTGFADRFLPKMPYWLEVRLWLVLLALESFLAVCYMSALHKIPLKASLPVNVAAIVNLVSVTAVPLNFYLRFNIIFVLISLAVQLYAFGLPVWLQLKKITQTRSFFLNYVTVHNFKIILYLLVFLGQAVEFAVIPFLNPPMRTYTFAKLSFLFFGIIQCGNAAFRRDMLTRRVNGYSSRLSFNNSLLSRFISEHMLNLLNIKDISKIIPGECRIIDPIIMYVGIKRFTHLMESVSKTEIYDTVRDLHAMIAPIIYETGGFVVKHLFYGSIVLFPEKNSGAISCAARIQKKTGEFRRLLRREHRTDADVGIVIHSGSVACGVLGSPGRLDSVAVSEDVNTALALGREISNINARILISEDAMPYCRVYSEFMYEGHFCMAGSKQMLVYSALPIVKDNEVYEEILESVEDDEDEK